MVTDALATAPVGPRGRVGGADVATARPGVEETAGDVLPATVEDAGGAAGLIPDGGKRSDRWAVGTPGRIGPGVSPARRGGSPLVMESATMARAGTCGEVAVVLVGNCRLGATAGAPSTPRLRGALWGIPAAATGEPRWSSGRSPPAWARATMLDPDFSGIGKPLTDSPRGGSDAGTVLATLRGEPPGGSCGVAEAVELRPVWETGSGWTPWKGMGVSPKGLPSRSHGTQGISASCAPVPTPETRGSAAAVEPSFVG